MSGSAIAELHEQLDKLCEALQHEVSDLVSFDSLPILLAIIEICKAIQQCAESAQAKVEVKGKSGDSFTVKVSTTTEALSVKKNISDTMGIPISKLSLLSTDNASNAVLVKSSQVIARIVPQPAVIDFIVREPLSFIPNLKLWMFSEESTDQLVDIVSGKAHQPIAFPGAMVPETPQVCNVLGRRGVQFTHSVLLEGEEANKFTSDAITISLWMLSPFKPRQAMYEGDFPSPPMLYQHELIGVGDRWLAVGDQEPYRTQPSPHDFDLTTMSAGWHHVCEVVAFPEMKHYIDGKFVGSMPLDFYTAERWNGEEREWIMSQHICMRPGHREGPGEVVISNLCVFACAANAEQIETLAQTT